MSISMAHLQFLLPGMLRWEGAFAPTQMSQLAADLMGTQFKETQSLIFTATLTHKMSTWVRNPLGFFFLSNWDIHPRRLGRGLNEESLR